MEMRVSSSVIVVLLLALLCWTCCSGMLKLCSDNLTGFENGTTILATVGEPVTISFCVQWHDSDGTFLGYIKIIHPNHLTQYGSYYSLSSVTTKLIVNGVVDRNTARINITVRKVEPADLTNVFAVGLATRYNNFRSGVTVFTFQLMLADPVADVTSAPPATTSVSSQCCPGKTPACPENWYQVDNGTCLMVNDTSHSSRPWTECSKLGAHALIYSEIKRFNCCLQKILDDSKLEYKEIVHINFGYANDYVGIRSRGQTGQPKADKLACFQSIQNFKPPSVPLFSLHECKSKVCGVADKTTGNVTVNITFNDFILKCESEGIPTPTVKITDESQKEIKSGEPITLANCSQPGVYTCTAKNHRGSSQSRKTIQIVNPTNVTDFTAARKTWGREIRLGDDVDLKCLVGGCPKQITITKGADLIAEVASFINSIVHEIKSVSCSHMGTYTCLGEFQSGSDVEATADLEVRDCPVTLCPSEDTPRELSAMLGENITFSVCLMSTVPIYRDYGNKTRMFVSCTKTPGSSFYWTANITIYGIQASDYRTHTTRLKNSYGALDYTFTLTYKGPVSLCQSEDTPRELSVNVGENITFSLCLMSTEAINKYSGNKTKMVVTFTRTSGSSFYWTANITIYGIQASDYRTHTVRIENINGGLDYQFRLMYKDPEARHSLPCQFDASVMIAVSATVGVIVGVTITVAIFLARVFFQKRSQRSEVVSQVVLPKTEYEEAAGTKHESTTQGTPAMGDLDIAQYMEIKDTQYERPVSYINSTGQNAAVLNSDVEYVNTVL